MVSRDDVTKSSDRTIRFKLDSGATEQLVNVRTFFNSVEYLRTAVMINVAKDGQNLVAKEEGVINGVQQPWRASKYKETIFCR